MMREFMAAACSASKTVQCLCHGGLRAGSALLSGESAWPLRHIEAATRVFLLVATFITLLTMGGCAETPNPAHNLPDGQFNVYFNNDGLTDGLPVCDAVFPVPRSSQPTTNEAAAALEMLFLGPTATERAQGYRSFFSERTSGLLKRLRIEAGTAYVDLHDRRRELAGATSSCGSAEFFSQIQHTLREFPSIERIIFAIEGKPDVFYDWMELECDLTNDNCDPRPFALP